MFEKAYSICRQLQHKNLVQLYGVCTTRPIYLITEFMKNGKLHLVKHFFKL